RTLALLDQPRLQQYRVLDPDRGRGAPHPTPVVRSVAEHEALGDVLRDPSRREIPPGAFTPRFVPELPVVEIRRERQRFVERPVPLLHLPRRARLRDL